MQHKLTIHIHRQNSRKFHSNMKLTLSCLCLCAFLVFFHASSFASAITHDDNNIFESSKTPQTQAEKLIRGFNLFPKHKVNIDSRGSSFSTSPRLVEKKFKFPTAGDSGASVEDLGHHAGYYRLPHSNDGRYHCGRS